ncbi:c-di-GMP phosphodiesterase [Vibrio sp. qd031]|uniref:sensor domain-containing protein n=1 Tax=Vibrio sp. qd031 TaxID=1603038 RepID=UPI000A113CD1|nr:EAL domain-containing protein [Vibrio sp. qd031]ORT49192.1 c-di-GMP phosphodiesterase [Vibrio sp. qd031]
MPSKQLHNWFSSFSQESPFFFAVLDRDHNYSFVNQRYGEIAGLDLAELIGLNDQDVLGEKFYHSMAPYYKRGFEGESLQAEIVIDDLHLESSLHFCITPLQSGDDIESISFHAVDTSEKQILAKSLHHSESKFTKLSALINDGVVIVENDVVVFINDSCKRILGFTNNNELLGQPFNRLFVDSLSKRAFNVPLETLVKDEPLNCFTSSHCPVERHIRLKADNSLFYGQDTCLFLLSEQTTHDSDAQQCEDRESHIDALTKHYNRAGFTGSLTKMIESDTPLLVLYLDIDNFKNVNDSLGHHVGDKVIVEVAHRLQKLLPSDAILGHLGGDEFGILFPRPISEKVADEYAEKILAEINRPFNLHHFSKRLACSIGSVVYPGDGVDARILLQNADTAMYEAKSRGRNRLIKFHDQMNKEARMRLWLEIELQKALQNNGLEVWYQPKVNARDFSINGAEALIRWKHPVEGYISPGAFIPVAEKAGLIEKLGRVVMREVFNTVKRWKSQQILPGRVAINLSPEQFGNPKLIEYMEKLLRTTNLPASCITFELTESAVMSDSDHTIQMLEGIKKLGFALSIDDFGTGYSSLSYLARFPIDELKIDRAFISEIDTLPKQVTVIENIINLGRSLGLTVVAEGVETREQATLLSNLNCHSIQGFHFYRPQPKHEVEQLLLQNLRHKK